MHNRLLLLLLLTLAFSFNNSAQNTGDTIVVNSLNYQSTTRDIVVNFPTNPNLTFEKVIMRYAMRCKNGLISPPIAGQTNLGCGEWDYSCNTYIEDPTKADSSSRTVERYLIHPDTNSSDMYSTIPTWQGSPIIQKTVSLQSIISEDTAQVGMGVLADSTIINSKGNGGKSYFLMSSSELIAAGLIAGDIDGFSFVNLGATSNLLNFKVKIKETSLNNLAFPDSIQFRNLQEVYYHNYNATNGTNRVAFHSPFNWNGSSNLLFEISYKVAPGNPKLELESHTVSSIQTISSSNDLAFNLFPNNYIEADSFQGISGSNPRTVEAWIKTSVSGKDIVSWGSNNSGRKFILRLDGTGRLRVEVNGGSYIGTKVLNDDKWHHVALTFNGSSMFHFRFYVDGVRDNPTAINNVGVNTAQSLKVQISRGFHGRYWEGAVDNVRIWSTNIADTTLANWRYRKIDASHPNYNNLELSYSINSQNSTILDQSPNGRNAEFKSHNSFESFIGEEHFKSFNTSTIRPNVSLYQGNYTLNIVNDTIIDTTFYRPYSVSENTIFPRQGTIFSDSIGVVQYQYWPKDNTLLDFAGNVSSTTSSTSSIQLADSTLSYFQRNARKLEIMSFVTPYGINLDLGQNGKAWYFDVSDFIPILKGNRRMTLERGGQWQEEMDIKFLFIVGTPPRDVKAIDQVWPVSSRPYTQIINDTYFAPKTLTLDTTANEYKLRSVITGHGQQGEFIPRNHFLNINGGPIEFNWTVWKECAENPIFPQGGTWIFDRAGWCPGMSSDIEEYDITSLVGGASTVTLDYGVTTASGDSRYIVNNQLVSYGAPNFSLDARITEVISPTSHAEFEKFNPACKDAEIVLQNSGSGQLTSAVIEYWINSGPKSTFNWVGNLNFLDDINIVLPTNTAFWSATTTTNNQFYARIASANGVSDQYSANDSIIRSFEVSDMLPPSFYIQFTTNNAASESSYDIRDNTGAILFQRNNMSNNSTYRDTFNLTAGCYSFNVYDSDDDGLSFFANNDGTGSVRINKIGGSLQKSFNSDFGDGFQYNFTLNTLVGIDEIEMGESIILYPNPTKNQISIETTGLENANWAIYDAQGREIQSGRIAQDHHSTSTLDVSAYDNGIYFIHFNKEGSTAVQKFIISK